MNRVVLLMGALVLTAVGCGGSQTADPIGGAAPAGAGPTTRTSESAASSTSAPTSPSPSSPPPTGTRPMSTTVLPTIQQPAAPPSLPSDQLTGLWVSGTVTAGTENRCATVTADDGRVLVLSGAATLVEGDAVKVRVVQPPRAVYCGDVEAWTLLEVVPAG